MFSKSIKCHTFSEPQALTDFNDDDDDDNDNIDDNNNNDNEDINKDNKK